MNKALYELSLELRRHYEEAENYKALWARANDELEVMKSKHNKLELVLAGKTVIEDFVQPPLAAVPESAYGHGAIVNGVRMYSMGAMLDYASINIKAQNYAFNLHLNSIRLGNTLKHELPPLPEPTLCSGCSGVFYNSDDMRAYGQTVQDDAINHYQTSTFNQKTFVDAPLPIMPVEIELYPGVFGYTQQQIGGYGITCMRDQLAHVKRHMESK